MNLSPEEAIRFAKYYKSYSSPKDPQEALNRFRLLESQETKDGIICKTGDRFARVKPENRINAIYQMCWCYRPSGRKGTKGKYFPSAYNLITHYMRTPMEGATPFDAPVHEWTVKMFLQALRYIPTDTQNGKDDWHDELYKVLSKGIEKEKIELAELPVPISLYPVED